MIIIKILIILIGLFYNSYSLNCEEEINKKDNPQEEERANYKFLKFLITVVTIGFHLGISPEDSMETKVNYLKILFITAVTSTMFGLMLREKLYGKDPEVQAKIEKELIEEIQKTQREDDDTWVYISSG